jgi:hypothetical protein
MAEKQVPSADAWAAALGATILAGAIRDKAVSADTFRDAVKEIRPLEKRIVELETAVAKLSAGAGKTRSKHMAVVRDETGMVTGLTMTPVEEAAE